MFADRITQIIPTSIRMHIRDLFELTRKQPMRAFYSQFIHPDDLVFDIGANVGAYTEIFSSLGAKVICVEPQPSCIVKLKQRFRNNNSITVVGKGVAEKRGKLNLHIDSRNITTASFSKKYITHGPLNNRNWEKHVDVPVTTLDELIHQFGKPKFCKIDVEGYELHVLKGLHTSIPSVSFEYTKKFLDETARCVTYLQTLGDMQLNFSMALDTTTLQLDTWTKSRQVLLDNIDKSMWYTGDVFVKFYP